MALEAGLEPVLCVGETLGEREAGQAEAVILRQLDAGESTIKPCARLAEKYGERLPIMMDSGIRSGSDIAASLASGAKFTFMGRSFMYGVGAMGTKGGLHTIGMIKRQLQQVMEQVACPTVKDLPKHLIKDES